jgi:2-methylcitrate dehydratase PrpD
MTLAALLAELGTAPVAPADLDALRALNATNAAAAIGELGASGRLIAGLPVDASVPAGAAYRFGAQLHARTQDDFHPLGRVHVGAVALAVTLALSDDVGDRTLECLAAGYEVMGAISVVYAAEAQSRGFRPTGLFGPLAAAACAARCLGLGQADAANAIALAAARSGGTNQSWLSGTDEWLLEAGNAARAGIEAALLTKAGLAAAPDALEGRAGWARAFFGDEGGARLAAGLAAPHPRIGEVAVKPYPVSGIAQIATALAVSARDWLGGGDWSEMIVHVAKAEADYPGSANRGPFRSRSDALMSIVFCAAAGLERGAVPLALLESPGSLGDAIARVRLAPDPGLAEGHARIEVRTAGDNRSFEGAAADLLHPSWPAVAADADALALRSEARADRVASIIAELARPRVDAGVLRGLIELVA